MGIGRMLLGCVEELSRDLSFDTVTLHVWDQNESVLQLYHNAGFKTCGFIDIVPDERLPSECGMLQMEAKVPFRQDCLTCSDPDLRH